MRRRAGAVAAIALALLIGTLGVTWALLYARPLPTIDGRYRLLGLDQTGEILRDRLGTPHLFAADAHDLYFLQGYVTAQDRLAQMEAMRDGALRVAGDAAARELARTPEPDRSALEAYAAGVTKLTHQLAAARALPAELVLRGRDPSDWTARDVLAIASVYLDHVDRSSLCAAAAASASASGRPVFAADVYIEAPEPGWYEVGLDGPDERAVGISLPGVPGMVAGHNGWVAWTILSSVRPGSGATVETVNGLLDGMTATTATAFADALRRTEVAACVADIFGREGGVDRGRASFLPADRALVFGGGDRREAASAAALRTARSVDSETLRLVLGRPALPFPGARLIVDLGSADVARTVVSGGSSALLASRHYRDQAPLWEIGQLHALPLSRAAIGEGEGDLVFRPR